MLFSGSNTGCSAVQNSSDSDDLASEVFVQQPSELPCGLTDLSYLSDTFSEYPFLNLWIAFFKTRAP